MTISSDRPYGESSPPPTRRRALGRRLVAIVALVVVILIVTSTSRVRSWWAHRLHDLTGASKPADFVIGLVIGLLPVIGVLVGAAIGRRRGQRGPTRALRMFFFGALGFIVTYLLAPSPAKAIAQHSATKVFEHEVPGYLAGVFTGVGIWVLALVVGLFRARTWWRRVTNRQPPRTTRGDHKVIDV